MTSSYTSTKRYSILGHIHTHIDTYIHSYIHTYSRMSHSIQKPKVKVHNTILYHVHVELGTHETLITHKLHTPLTPNLQNRLL